MINRIFYDIDQDADHSDEIIRSQTHRSANAMNTAPCNPRNGLSFITRYAKVSRGRSVIILNLAAKLNADSWHVLKADTATLMNAPCMPIDAYLVEAIDTGRKLTQLRSAQDRQDGLKGWF
jgi:hypothetical protein